MCAVTDHNRLYASDQQSLVHSTRKHVILYSTAILMITMCCDKGATSMTFRLHERLMSSRWNTEQLAVQSSNTSVLHNITVRQLLSRTPTTAINSTTTRV
jgi:hypothetical protein